MVSQILMEQGFGTQLLAAVYRFKDENTVYWIYNFKLGPYYPFMPSGKPANGRKNRGETSPSMASTGL